MTTIDANEQTSLKVGLIDRKKRLEDAISESGVQPDLQRLLCEVDAALSRIDSGTFGLCETCHEEIEQDRLRVDPLLRNCLEHLTRAERRSLERDLDLAHQVQLNLLPNPNELRAGWRIAYAYEPAGAVSGDFCDLITVKTGKVGFYFFLGDVSGKGVAASLMVASLHGIFRTLTSESRPLNQLLIEANRLLCESSLSNHYATLVCGRAYPDGWLELINAGHCLPLILRSNRVEKVESHGLPIGLFCSTTYTSQTIHLNEGESIALYSDGLVEALDSRGSYYGEERLEGQIWNARDGGPQALVETTLKDLHGFASGTTRNDDCTLLVMQREKITIS